VQRFGVWVDGQFAWIEDAGWQRSLKYLPDTLVTNVLLRHERLGLEITCNDAVDFHEPVYFRRAVVKDLIGKDRDVRLFSHWTCRSAARRWATQQLRPADQQRGRRVQGRRVLPVQRVRREQVRDRQLGHRDQACARAEGTWRDAEDGQLGRNAISQGSVDATIGFNLQVPRNGTSYVTSWLRVHVVTRGQGLNQRILEKGPDRMIGGPTPYWNLWVARTDGGHPLKCRRP